MKNVILEESLKSRFLTIFGNFSDFWGFWGFLTILGNFGVFGGFCQVLGWIFREFWGIFWGP